MLDRTPSPGWEPWPSTQRRRTALRPLLRFWVVLLAAGAGGAGVLQALGPPPKAFPAPSREASTAPALIVSVDGALGAPPVSEPVPTPEPVEEPVPPTFAPATGAPARVAERPPSSRAAARAGTLVRRRSVADRLHLALGRLRREQPVMSPTQDENEVEATDGEEAGYAAAEPWHAPVQYPWLYGWPTGAQAYSDIYAGRR